MHRFLTSLPHRGVVRIVGTDRHTFLQGLISNDVNLCTPQQPLYAALLTAQGKFLHDMFLVDTGEAFLIDCELARADDLLKRLSMYKLRAKVTLENITADYTVWACSDNKIKEGIIYDDPRMPELGMRAIKKTDRAETIDFNIYDKHRLFLGVPDGSRDMVIEKSTLIECNLDRLHAISWTKGCYIGQELTARMHYRALAKKRLFPVTFDGRAPPFGTLIQIDTQEMGEMRSSCEMVGLALLNIEKAEAALRARLPLICGDSQLHVLDLSKEESAE